MLTDAQLVVLAAAIQSETDPEFVALRDAGATGAMAEWFNEDSTFVVWKTSLSETEIVGEASPDNTFWDWVAYSDTAVADKMTWERIFNGTYTINPSLPNIRQGIADIFSGPQGAGQRAHLLAMAKRMATRGEELFAVGTGSQADPGTMTFEGRISNTDVIRALAI